MDDFVETDPEAFQDVEPVEEPVDDPNTDDALFGGDWYPEWSGPAAHWKAGPRPVTVTVGPLWATLREQQAARYF